MAKKQTRVFSYTVNYRPIREGGYEVTVPLMPGLVTYGRTIEEAHTMARDAMACHIGALRKDHEEVPEEQSLIQERLSVSVHG